MLQDVENNVSGDRKCARRVTGNEDINDLVYEWFKEVTAKRMPLSGPLLQAQTLRLAEDLGETTFKASTGWLASFLNSNNIALGTVSGKGEM